MAALKTLTYSSDYAHSSVPHYWIDLVVTQNSKSDEDNTSSVTFKLLGRSDPDWALSFKDRLGYIEANSERIASANTHWGNGYGDGGNYKHTICSVTKTFNHNTDGSLSIPVKGYFDYSGIVINDKYTLHSVSVSATFKCESTSPKPTLTISSTSSTTDTIKINWSSTYKLKTIYYRYSSDDGSTYTSWKNKTVNSATSGSISISGLTDNTKYTIQVKGTSVAGVTSATKTITKTTVAEAVPGEINISSATTTIETISIKWSCDKYITTLNYKVSDQTAKSVNISKAKSGSLKITKLSPNSSYSIKLSGVDEDGLTTNTASTAITTKDYSRITSLNPTLIFGDLTQEITLKTPDTTSTLNFEFYVGDKLIISQTTVNSVDKAILTFNDDILDTIYKLFGNSSTLDTTYKIITKGTNDYSHTTPGTLKLTGNAKTVKVGLNNSVHRAKVFVCINGQIKQAVAWTKSNNQIRRTI